MPVMKRPGINSFQSWSVIPVYVLPYSSVQPMSTKGVLRSGYTPMAIVFRRPRDAPAASVSTLRRRSLPSARHLPFFPFVCSLSRMCLPALMMC